MMQNCELILGRKIGFTIDWLLFYVSISSFVVYIELEEWNIIRKKVVTKNSWKYAVKFLENCTCWFINIES